MGEVIASLERHGELTLDDATRTRIVSLSAATIDRWLRPTRTSLPRRPRTGPAALGGLASEVAVRTFAEWADAVPGEVQGDLVVHCGVSTAGFYLTSLVLVDVATGWLDELAEYLEARVTEADGASETLRRASEALA